MLTTAQLVATLLGVACGLIMTAMLIFIPLALKKRALKKNSQYVMNDFMPQDMAYSFVGIMTTFLAFTLAIFVYYLVAPHTLVWFSVTALSCYFAGFSVYAAQKIVKERKSLGK